MRLIITKLLAHVLEKKIIKNIKKALDCTKSFKIKKRIYSGILELQFP